MTPSYRSYTFEDRSKAQTTPNWPENTEDAFQKMIVPSLRNPEPQESIWPYEINLENKPKTDEKGSPKLLPC